MRPERCPRYAGNVSGCFRNALRVRPENAASLPEDLAEALANNPRAEKFFATLEAHNRYAVLWRVQNAKKAETRARRIAQFVEMLAKREKLHP